MFDLGRILVRPAIALGDLGNQNSGRERCAHQEYLKPGVIRNLDEAETTGASIAICGRRNGLPDGMAQRERDAEMARGTTDWSP